MNTYNHVVTHKYRRINGQQAFLVNLVDGASGSPLESKVADTEKEKVMIANQMAEKHSVSKISHNTGYSLVAKNQQEMF